MAAILIVDDEAQVRDLLYGLFEAEHRCHTAESAEQALEMIEAGNYDVILMDVSMPGMSGLELLTHTRRLQPRTPVIIITGIDYQRHFGELITAGAFDYLLKPFSMEAAEEMVARALGRYGRRRGKRNTDRDTGEFETPEHRVEGTARDTGDLEWPLEDDA